MNQYGPARRGAGSSAPATLSVSPHRRAVTPREHLTGETLGEAEP